MSIDIEEKSIEKSTKTANKLKKKSAALSDDMPQQQNGLKILKNP